MNASATNETETLLNLLLLQFYFTSAWCGENSRMPYEKTLRKWTWMFVDQLAGLEPCVVSKVLFCFDGRMMDALQPFCRRPKEYWGISVVCRGACELLTFRKPKERIEKRALATGRVAATCQIITLLGNGINM